MCSELGRVCRALEYGHSLLGHQRCLFASAEMVFEHRKPHKMHALPWLSAAQQASSGPELLACTVETWSTTFWQLWTMLRIVSALEMRSLQSEHCIKSLQP